MEDTFTKLCFTARSLTQVRIVAGEQGRSIASRAA